MKLPGWLGLAGGERRSRYCLLLRCALGPRSTQTVRIDMSSPCAAAAAASRQHLGIDAADFRVIGEHFRRSDQAARSKYYYWTKVERHLPEGKLVQCRGLC